METPVNIRFSEIINRLIERPEIKTYKEMSKILGMKSPSSLTGMMKGDQQPTIEVLILLYNKYNTDIFYIITGQRRYLKPTPELPDDKDDLLGSNPELDPEKLMDEYYRRKEELKKEVIDEIVKKLTK